MLGRRRHLAFLALAFVLVGVATLIGVRHYTRTGRTGTVTIERRIGGGNLVVVMPLGSPGEIAYLDSDVRALRIQLIIRPDERQDAFTARLYDDARAAPVRVEHIAAPRYARVVGDAFDRHRLRLPGEPEPVATSIAVTFTIPTEGLRHEQPYVVRLSGARDQRIAEYAFTTN